MTTFTNNLQATNKPLYAKMHICIQYKNKIADRKRWNEFWYHLRYHSMFTNVEANLRYLVFFPSGNTHHQSALRFNVNTIIVEIVIITYFIANLYWILVFCNSYSCVSISNCWTSTFELWYGLITAVDFQVCILINSNDDTLHAKQCG